MDNLIFVIYNYNMNKYIVLLRGINVSGQKKIKMADFKIKLFDCGYINITTYLQSGNIVLDSENSIIEIKSEIEKLIEKTYNFSIPVYVTTRKYINNVVDSLPFKNINIESEGSNILVTFLYNTPLEVLTNKLLTYVKLSEELVFKDNII